MRIIKNDLCNANGVDFAEVLLYIPRNSPHIVKKCIGNLINRYFAVLKKCHLLNSFGSLALVATMSVRLSVGNAHAAGFTPTLDAFTAQEIKGIMIATASPDLDKNGDMSQAEQNAWSVLSTVWNTDPDSAYTVTDITAGIADDFNRKDNYFTTFAVKEEQKNSFSKNKTQPFLKSSSG